MATLQIPQHQHCTICGSAMPFDPAEKTCSSECAATLAALQKRRKRSLYMIYGMIGLSVVVFFLTLSGKLK